MVEAELRHIDQAARASITLLAPHVLSQTKFLAKLCNTQDR
jgi:hypothetical protein